MHCVVSLLFQLCRLGNGSGKRKTNSHPSTFKLLSISIVVNSQVLNSPHTLQKHLKLLTSSKNILLVHEVVVKRHAASRKMQTQFGRKNWFQFVVEKQVKLIVKNIMHIQENEVAP